jgi:hypothetical protein
MDDLRDIKTRRPWRLIRPAGYLKHGSFDAEEVVTTPNDKLSSDMYLQTDMLRQYFTSGHLIFDRLYYPDIFREVDEPVLDVNGEDSGKTVRRVYRECVPRYAFAFQQIFALKQTIHLCGNDIQFELNRTKVNDSMQRVYDTWREEWLAHNLETAFFFAVTSEKIVADTAFVGYLDNGVYKWQVLSFKNGDTLYPHYDNTGKMYKFARSYFAYDENGEKKTEYLEVWDSKYFARYRASAPGHETTLEKIKGALGLSGYTLLSKTPHGFPFIPVAYKRNEDGPCWAAAQDTCDSYDLSFSQLAQNNQAYGTPILIFQGEGENYDAQHDINGTVRTISMSKDDKVSYLEAQSASDSYHKQLETLYKMAYEQAFCVTPPEMKSGDLPGVALKLLYSPALEKAMFDAADWQPFLNEMVKITRFGLGVEKEMTLAFDELPLVYWIKPYVHVNESAVVADLASAVNSGFCSKQTASERISEYTTVAEWERILKEKKEEESADLLYTIRASKQADNQTAAEDNQ